MGKGNDSAFRMNASSRELDGKPIRPRKRPTTALQLHLVANFYLLLKQIKIEFKKAFFFKLTNLLVPPETFWFKKKKKGFVYR